jgi:3-phosphoshikimate 1-carboxyvinyltransferase
MGIKVTEEENRLTITGSPAPSRGGSETRPYTSPSIQGAQIDSRGDHRIAMAFSLLGMVAGGTIIEDAECVSKTYPEYWDTLKSIGGEVKLDGK